MSRKLLLICFVCGRRMIPSKLLSLCVRQDGPATIGLSFKSLTPSTSTNEESACLHHSVFVLLLCFFGSP